MSHMKRKRYTIIALVLLAIGLLSWWLWPCEIADELLAQIKPGMTLDQTTNLLGKPVPHSRCEAFVGSGPGYSSWRMPEVLHYPEINVNVPIEMIPFTEPGFRSEHFWVRKNTYFGSNTTKAKSQVPGCCQCIVQEADGKAFGTRSEKNGTLLSERINPNGLIPIK